MSAPALETTPGRRGGLDLLRLPVLGPFLRWRGTRLVFQLLLLALSAVLILHGLFGPSLAPKNLATLLAWIHYRGILVLVLLVAGNLFCYACPFLLVRDLGRRWFRPAFNWPRALRNKWLSVALFVLILFCYERFSLWESPVLTAWLAVGYFVAAFAADAVFKHASFCKWVCPIGQFNFVASTVSPLEVQVRDHAVCDACTTKDCIRGRRAEAGPGEEGRRTALPVVQRGCELALFQPRKVGNLDCTFCLDCVQACPHDNVGVVTRLPGDELVEDPGRSGIGQFSRRPDLAVLAAVFTFGALLNAFGMVSPVYALQAWLAQTLGTRDHTVILGLIFVTALVVEPAVLLGAAGWLSRRLAGSREGLLTHVTRRSFALVPLGFCTWVAHYGFHFFTGFLTVVPVTQYALQQLGVPAGEPRWDLGGMSDSAVYPLELGFLGLGVVGSLLVAYRQAEHDGPGSPFRSALPWMGLCLLLGATAVWLLSQPMEMRGTFLGG